MDLDVIQHEYDVGALVISIQSILPLQVKNPAGDV